MISFIVADRIHANIYNFKVYIY